MTLFLQTRSDLFNGQPKKMLHVAPEPAMTRVFRSVEHLDYLSADLSSPQAMVKFDITAIPLADDTFDVIYCSHVLEHIIDDRTAIAELYRVLKPGGWAILQVPILGESTLEDATVKTPLEREKLYGNSDHVRQYGRDYAERLQAGGFEVVVNEYARTMHPRQIQRYGLLADEDIYQGHKRS